MRFGFSEDQLQLTGAVRQLLAGGRHDIPHYR